MKRKARPLPKRRYRRLGVKRRNRARLVIGGAVVVVGALMLWWLVRLIQHFAWSGLG